MNLLYIGAGTDLEILKMDLNVQMYFFIDSQPRSEFGGINTKFFERPLFMKKLKNDLKKLGFFKVKRFVLSKKRTKGKGKYYDDGVVIFRSKDYSKFLYYFYSTTFPTDEHVVNEFISKSNVLYVCGHEPDSDVIEMMSKPIVFVGSDTTCYTQKDSEQSGLFRQLEKHKDDIFKWYMLRGNPKEIFESSYEEIFSTK